MISLKLRKAVIIALLCALLSCASLFSFSQYILNGSAIQNTCNCYTLTPAQFTQAGSVWNGNKINLNNSFDFSFNVYLGCVDVNGADGIVFMLQPISTSIGGSGEGMGFSGITPSIGITLDTWQNFNLNDPSYDHISIQANGNALHGSDLAGPVQASSTSDNVEDCQWHVLRVTWDAGTQWLRAYFDNVLRVEAQVNLVVTIFNNDPDVYWGFTAATGGANNLQQFCTALNPIFTTNAQNDAVCFGTPVTFIESSISFAPIQSWYWDFGDGTTSIQQNPIPHNYGVPGIYEVKLAIRGLDGCRSDTLRKQVTIGSKPVAGFQVFDTCIGKPIRVINQSTNQVGPINQWTWLVNGSVASTDQQPIFAIATPGLQTVKLVVRSTIGCESDTITKTFIARPAPVISMNVPDGCLSDVIRFNAEQLDNATVITQWNWDFGSGITSNVQNPSMTFTNPGWKSVSLTAIATNGCSSNTLIDSASIQTLYAQARNDTLVLTNGIVKLSTAYTGNFSGPSSVRWTPSTGLDDPNSWTPNATVQNDIIYQVTVTSNAGCVATDSVIIKVFKGSAVYVPTGFTPNGDGRNDFLRGLYVGIRRVYYFRVYNRWGQQIFSTTNLIEGWDGTIRGAKQSTGTYVWMLKAEDLAGKIYEMKGVATLIR
jgi:gliding motility-associated-like protein